MERSKLLGNKKVKYDAVPNEDTLSGSVSKDLGEVGGEPWQQSLRPYSVYVLFILLATYLFNQLDRYMLAITIKPMAQEIHFGDLACMVNNSVPDVASKGVTCNGTTSVSCERITNENGTRVCKFDYDGQGFDYQIVAGPVFILIYTFSGIFVGLAANRFNRKNLLAGCLLLWSTMTLLTGFIQEYWHLVLLRLGLGLGEAGCTPFAASLITDYFSKDLRGTALGVYNWGIYIGYSMSYAFGNYITLGWRWAFIISGIPGIFFAILLVITVKEPTRSISTTLDEEKTISTRSQRIVAVLKSFLIPSLFLICIAGSIRNAAGYVFAYNTQPYFTAIGQTKEDIGEYMSWIPLVGGSLSVLIGGFISDRVVRRLGMYARVIVIFISLIVAAPFAAGTLFLSPPYAYISQIPTYIIGEMWIGITLAIVVEIVPDRIRTSAIALYLFIISNIGGNMPLLVPPIQEAFQNQGYNKADALRGALYILYPGLYVAGAILFVFAMLVLKRDQRRMRESQAALIQK
ncbi:hypothetical protein ScPMuIL_009965 [Solemya velum]